MVTMLANNNNSLSQNSKYEVLKCIKIHIRYLNKYTEHAKLEIAYSMALSIYYRKPSMCLKQCSTCYNN